MIEIVLALSLFLALVLTVVVLKIYFRDRDELHFIRTKLSENQSILEHIFNDSPLSNVLCDSEGYLIQASPSFYELYKVGMSELAGKTLWSFIDSDYQAVTRRMLDEVSKSSIKLRDVVLTRNAVNEQIWTQIDLIPMSNKKILVALANVSSAVRNGELLERFQQGLDQVQVLAITDRRGIITYVNEAFTRLTGYRPEEIIGKSHGILRSNHHSKEFFETLWTTILSGQSWKGQIKNRSKEGTEYWIETTILPFIDVSGSPRQFIAVSQEITQKKEAEESLRETLKTIEFENKIWRVIDRVQTNLLVLRNDKDMIPILLQIVCEDLGWDYAHVYQRRVVETSEEMIHLQSFSMNPYRQTVLDGVVKNIVLHRGEDLPGVCWEKQSPVWLESFADDQTSLRSFSASGIKIASALCVPLLVNGYLYGIIEMQSEQDRPIDTMVSRAMVVISSYFGKVLERQIQDKKEEEFRDQLALSAKMSTLGEMASGIAHEINNPLSIVTGYAQAAIKQLNQTDTIDKEQLVRTFDRIIATAFRINKIVKGLRSFARDGSADSFVAVTVKSIIEDSVALCDVKIKDSNVALQLSPFSEDLTIECRSVQISQIIINLINNGVDAIEGMNDKWVRIEVVDLGDQVEIVVVDSGLGIPESLAIKIMLPFFTTKPTGKGTGLGLSIARGIAESHNGIFGIHKERPNTTFFLRLPKVQACKEYNSDSKHSSHSKVG